MPGLPVTLGRRPGERPHLLAQAEFAQRLERVGLEHHAGADLPELANPPIPPPATIAPMKISELPFALPDSGSFATGSSGLPEAPMP